MIQVRFSPVALKYFKKMRDKQLKRAFLDAINKIADNPHIGQMKTGSLAGIYGYDLYYKGVNYEIAYTIEEQPDGSILVVIMAGTRENFYEQLKRYLY